MNKLFFIFGLLHLVFTVQAETLLSGDQILKKSESFRGFEESFVLTVRIENFKGAEKIESTQFNVMVKDNTTSLAEQTDPPPARGRKLLMVENDMWLHTPDIKKAIRISLEQKLTGEASNGDIAKTNFYGDYESKVLESTAEFIKLQLDAKATGTTYKQIIYFVHPKTYLPLRAEFMAASGKLLKTAVYGGLKKMSGRNLITDIRISDGLQKNRTSKLTYLKIKKEKMDDSLFNRSSL